MLISQIKGKICSKVVYKRQNKKSGKDKDEI